MNKYTVRGYRSEDTESGCDDEQGADTLKDAKRIAKHWLTEEYMHSIESTTMTVRVLVFRGNECLEDYSATGEEIS